MTSEKEITLGEFLRHERERRGVTIEQVASATKVGVRVLHSLEGDHYHELPAKPFIRGFVTSYCRFIGLDSKDVLSRYDEFINSKASERPNRDSGHSGYAFEKKDGEQQSRTILMFAIVGFIALGGMAMIFLKPALRHRHSSHIDKLRAAHQEAPPQSAVQASPSPDPIKLVQAKPESIEKNTPQPVPSPSVSAPVIPKSIAEITAVNRGSPGTNAQDPLDSGLILKPEEIHHKVSFKVLADIWVRYQVDDRPMRKFIVRKGKSLILRAKDGLRVQVSNPVSVKFSYNGRSYALMSQEKKVVEREGNATLYFPSELAEKLPKPFEGDPPLEKTLDPEPDPPSQVADPTPSPTP